MGGASGANYKFLMALQQQLASNWDTARLIDPVYYTKAQIYEAIRTGKTVTASVPEINPTMFLNGITHYRQHQLASALVFLWSTAESLNREVVVGEGRAERLWDHGTEELRGKQ